MIWTCEYSIGDKTKFRHLLTMSHTISERVIDINLLGSVRVARHFTPLLLESNGAKVFMVITSVAAHFAHSILTPIAYNTSKISACRLAEHMANDHGKQGLLAYAVHVS